MYRLDEQHYTWGVLFTDISTLKTGFFEWSTLRYDERSKRMDPGFPRLIQKDWPGVPTRVDAAFKLHGKETRFMVMNFV